MPSRELIKRATEGSRCECGAPLRLAILGGTPGPFDILRDTTQMVRHEEKPECEWYLTEAEKDQ